MKRVVWAALASSFLPLAANAAKEPSTPQARASTEGFMVVRLAHNVGQVSVFFLQFDQITVRAEDGKGKTYVLIAPHPTYALGQLRSTLDFGDWLPPGKYSITALGSRAGAMTTTADVSGTLLPFEVSAGQVTDLGLLVLQPTGDGKAVLFPAADSMPTDSVLQRAAPQAAPAFGSKPAIKWDGVTNWVWQRFAFGDSTSNLGLVGQLIQDQVEKGVKQGAKTSWSTPISAADYRKVAQGATVSFSQTPAFTPDGAAYFGSSLGQVLRRSPEGVWENFDTGQLADITSVATHGADEVVAGTEYGDLLRSTDGGKTFTLAGTVADKGRLVDVRALPTGNWLITSRSAGEKGLINTSVYIADSLAAIPSAPSKTVSQPNAHGAFKMVPSFLVPVAGKSAYYLPLPGIELQGYDYSTRTWSQLASQKAARNFISNNDGSVLYGAVPPQFSTDGARTWTDFKPNGTLNYVTFFDNSNAVALFFTDKLAWVGTQELRASTDGGQTWQKVSSLPKSPCDFRTVRQLDAQKKILCIFRDGGIYSSGTAGPWVLERAIY